MVKSGHKIKLFKLRMSPDGLQLDAQLTRAATGCNVVHKAGRSWTKNYRKGNYKRRLGTNVIGFVFCRKRCEPNSPTVRRNTNAMRSTYPPLVPPSSPEAVSVDTHFDLGESAVACPLSSSSSMSPSRRWVVLCIKIRTFRRLE